MSSDTPYSARVRTVELLERGKAQTTELEIYRNGAQIAQWVGTRTTHPGGTGFETGPPPKPGCESACFPQGLFAPPKTRPKVFP